MSAPLIIAIDGPSGSGKSSVSKGVASALGLTYLDTGSMYRAMTWFVQNRGIDVANTGAIAQIAPDANIEPSTDPNAPGITVDGIDVSEPIRGDEVTGGVSAVSAVPEVRALLVQLQRDIAHAATNGIVVEGRDIGPVVLPDADIQIFPTADESARAARRAAEVGGVAEDQQAKLAKRDHADSTRKVSPLAQASDAVVVDTTHMNLNEVIDHVVALAKAAR